MKEERFAVKQALRTCGVKTSSFDGMDEAMSFAKKAVAEDRKTVYAVIEDKESKKLALVVPDEGGTLVVESLLGDVRVVKESGCKTRILPEGVPYLTIFEAREDKDVEFFLELDFWRNSFAGFRKSPRVKATIARLEM